MNVELRDYFAAHWPYPGEIVTWDQIKKFKGLPPDTPIEARKDEYILEWECAKRYEYADFMMKARKDEKKIV